MANENKIELHNCVDILIFNDRNELALQMRALNDRSFPGYWDFSAGGHVDPKEVERVEFFSLPTIQKMIDEGRKFHPEFLLAWEKGMII